MSRPQNPFTVRHKDVWAIALPASIAFITEPVAGIIDTAVIGQLGDSGLLGGLVLGALAFDVIFSLAFFLRLGTAGLTAQAVGARDPHDGLLHLARSFVVALAFGALVLILAVPLHWLFAIGLAPGENVATPFADYFYIRIWSAPFVLINFVLLGWLYGRAAATTGMVLQLLVNVINIALSIWFVLGLGWGVPGVAWATVIGQGVAALIGIAIVLRHYGGLGRLVAATPLAALGDVAAVTRMVGLSRDLIIRTLALMAAFAWFAGQGSRMGEIELSANAILLHLFFVAAYFLDGLAQAAEQLCGKAVGANWRSAFERATTLSLAWGLLISGALAIGIFIFGGAAIDLMTTHAEVRDMARVYLVMAALTPLTGMPAFVYDGIMIGATLNTTMRNGMLLSLAIYIALAVLLQPLLGLWGLWIAFNIFLAGRAVIYAWAIERRKPTLFS
jgi:putative MATE family efflux protein